METLIGKIGMIIAMLCVAVVLYIGGLAILLGMMAEKSVPQSYEKLFIIVPIVYMAFSIYVMYRLYLEI